MPPTVLTDVMVRWGIGGVAAALRGVDRLPVGPGVESLVVPAAEVPAPGAGELLPDVAPGAPTPELDGVPTPELDGVPTPPAAVVPTPLLLGAPTAPPAVAEPVVPRLAVPDAAPVVLMAS